MHLYFNCRALWLLTACLHVPAPNRYVVPACITACCSLLLPSLCSICSLCTCTVLTISLFLPASDCFGLAVHAYNGGDYYHMLDWALHALEVRETEVHKTISQTQLLDYLSYAAAMVSVCSLISLHPPSLPPSVSLHLSLLPSPSISHSFRLPPSLTPFLLPPFPNSFSLPLPSSHYLSLSARYAM